MELKFHPIPSLAHLSPEAYQAQCLELVEEIMAEARNEHVRFLGVRKILKQNPHHRPASSENSPLPVCHASTNRSWLDYLSELRAFVSAYRRAASEYGVSAPQGTYPTGSFLPGGKFVAA